jgi:hypothetical protein
VDWCRRLLCVVAIAPEDVGTRDEGPALCPGIVALLPTPTRSSFLFCSERQMMQQAEGIVCLPVFHQLNGLHLSFSSRLSLSLYPSPHERRFRSSFIIPVVFVATREGKGVSTNIWAFKILSSYLSAFTDVTVN